MKHMKKIMALVIAMVMVIGMTTTAWATAIGTSSTGTGTGQRTYETEISVSGLDQGDVVKVYKVLEWEDSTGWKLTSDFSGVTTLDQYLGTNNKAIPVDTAITNDVNKQITSSTRPDATGSPDASGTYKVTNLTPGMYIAIVTPATPGVVYNPIIVSADYEIDGKNTVDASNSEIPNSVPGKDAVAKKSKITLEKTGDSDQDHDNCDPETVAVGDTLTFTVKTEIPPFAGYQDPSFVLTDEMTSGLKYDKTTGIVLTKPAGLTAGNEYTVSGETDSGYVITFDPEYLKTVATNTEVEYTYKATVTTDAVKSVNPENNTITLEYNNNPNNGADKTKLRDRTNHYTFNIDGDLLGVDNYSATEVVKVGVSADGTEITKTTQLSNSNWVGALQNAEFALYAVTDQEFADAKNFNTTGKTAYSNKDKDGNTVSYANIKSGADGRISIKGIDGGKYLLVETKAPEGYIKRQTPVQIEIVPTVKNVEYDDVEADGTKVHVKTTELVSYKVYIDGTETAAYSITNSKDKTKASSTPGDSVVGVDDSSGKIKNTQGVELPSTGGIGTTLFYLIGAILVVGAGILLVTRRRMRAE